MWINIVAHIDNDKNVVQDFMSLLEENKIINVHSMVLKLEAWISVVNQDQAFEAGFSNERSIVYEAKLNSKWIG
jgi:hypothetical protein